MLPVDRQATFHKIMRAMIFEIMHVDPYYSLPPKVRGQLLTERLLGSPHSLARQASTGAGQEQGLVLGGLLTLRPSRPSSALLTLAHANLPACHPVPPCVCPHDASQHTH